MSPRTGRPPQPRDPDGDRLRPLLVAPLLAPTVRWTSRTVADLAGCTQSAVARAWADAYTGATGDLGDRLPASGLRLVGAVAHPGNSLLVLSAAGPATPAPAGPFMRSPRRPALQTLLAADLLAAGRAPSAPASAPEPPSSAGQAAEQTEDAAFLADLVGRLGPAATVHLVSRRPVPAGAVPAAQRVVVDDAAAWQGLLGELVRRCTRSPEPELVAAQHQAMEWARSGRPRFEWAADRSPSGSATVAARPAERPGLPDQLLEVLLARVGSGRVAAGGRVTEASLARGVHASRSQVRDALRALASSGLIDLEPHRGAVVPTPQTADVLETYAARRALGALIVRRAAHVPPGALAAAEEALQRLVEVGRSGDSWATGQADLRFQDTLATSTGMRRLPALFRTLTAQLRLFIAVMGLDYTYSIPGMLQDDTALMERLRERDEAGAVRVWHRKIDDAADYMTSQLAISDLRRGRRGGPG